MDNMNKGNDNMRVFHKTDYGIIGFGKFNGQKWSDVPEDYLHFICSDECYTNEGNKEIARQELKQRNISEGQILMFGDL